ncbi:MAG: hypothetical protein IPO37_21825 [Saprospiraceae bacterium]|nr:hypothetical protein [Saprospiraceae bacterium]
MSKSYLTLTERIIRSLTGCKIPSPVMRPADKSPKVIDFGQHLLCLHLLSLSESYLTLTEFIIRSLTGCKNTLSGHETGR